MKKIVLKFLFLINYIMLILYMGLQMKSNHLPVESYVPLLISSLMLIDMTGISACNIRENKVISLFCALLALDSWYLVLSFGESRAESLVFTGLSPIIWFVAIRFILMFLFQGSGYRFRKAVNQILFLTCFASIAGLCISDRAFACMYGIQFGIGILCILFVVGFHWKRAAFVLKSEWKSILVSGAVTILFFLSYFFATIDVQGHISNFGIYLPAMMFFMSIHGIILKEHSGFPLSTVFHRKQMLLILCSSILLLGVLVLSMGGGYGLLLIAVNLLFAFLYLCNIILEENLKRGDNKIVQEGRYAAALKELRQEEVLKKEFADFLHDDVLQDMLSIKNMMTKVHRPEVQYMIVDTLNNLNIHIREQMQDYHPVILKKLTMKENCQNLMDEISQTFQNRNIQVSFECPDSLFLVEPYDVLVYRILKELLTNVYKHSDGSRAWIMLSQEKGRIDLSVSDSGTAHVSCLTSADKKKHKGIYSVTEQVNALGGKILFADNVPHGVCIQITIPMKGEISYQYFVS